MFNWLNRPKITSPLSGRLAARPDIYVVEVEVAPRVMKLVQDMKGQDGSLDHMFEKVYGCCSMMGEFNPTREGHNEWGLTDMRTATHQVVGFGIPDGKPVAWILPFTNIDLAKQLCDQIQQEKVIFKLRISTRSKAPDKLFLTIDAYTKEVC